jgi:hypothetical protein
MKDAGCVALGYGVETGSDRLLKLIKKGITTNQIRRAMTITRELGFEHVSLFLMTSLPGQTLEDIRVSSEFLSEMHTILSGTPVRKAFLGTPTLIYPGTDLERIARHNDNVFPNAFSWNKYYRTDRAKVFGSNPFVPHFENPGLSLEQIKACALDLNRAWGKKRNLPWRVLDILANVRCLKDLGKVVLKIFKAIPSLLSHKE